MKALQRLSDDSKGIIILKLGGVITDSPRGGSILFQHNNSEVTLGYEMFEHPLRFGSKQSYKILYANRYAYIAEWDVEDYFERV